MAILATFLFHVIAGSFQLFGFIPGGSAVMHIIAGVMLTAICVHVVIGVKLTADTLTAIKKSGASYFRENKLFWIRRISGFAVMLLIIPHIIVFMGSDNGGFRLNLFDIPQLIMSVLLVLALLLHVVTNIRPLMLAFGAGRLRELAADAGFILSVVLVFAGAAFTVYYLRWLG